VVHGSIRVTALAALAGAAVGGFASVIASWLTQQAQLRAQWTSQDILQRQDLYKEFIEAAFKCYVHALQHGEADIPALVELYAKLGRMRVLSSPGSSRAPNKSNERSSTRI